MSSLQLQRITGPKDSLPPKTPRHPVRRLEQNTAANYVYESCVCVYMKFWTNRRRYVADCVQLDVGRWHIQSR